jgi:hypothetical protein
MYRGVVVITLFSTTKGIALTNLKGHFESNEGFEWAQGNVATIEVPANTLLWVPYGHIAMWFPYVKPPAYVRNQAEAITEPVTILALPLWSKDWKDNYVVNALKTLNTNYFDTRGNTIMWTSLVDRESGFGF